MSEYKIAERLSELRMSKGVTQEDVANSLSISNKTVSKWECGASEPDLSMLIALSEYYEVSTDSLLGVSKEKDHTVNDFINSAFKDSTRREAVLKAFKIVNAIIPNLYEKTTTASIDNLAIPTGRQTAYRSKISTCDFFDFTANSSDVNIAVMLLRNESDFIWLSDAEKQEKIVRFFKFLADNDVLSVIYFINSEKCSKTFTADYISANTGIPEEKITSVLNEFCNVGECRYMTAHLLEGEAKIYECYGDGLIMSVATLAYERMCGKETYNYNISGLSKLIGGK